MFDSWPIFGVIKTRAVVFYMALLANLYGLAPKARLRGRCVVPTRAVAYLALNVFQVRGIQFTNKATRKIKANHMANQTFWVKGLVDFSQSVISPTMSRI